jgi:hypothetical protein
MLAWRGRLTSSDLPETTFRARPSPMTITIECVLQCGNHLGEGPVWDVEQGCLYWVDGTGRRVGHHLSGADPARQGTVARP